MTQREFLQNVIAANVNEEMTAYATEAIAKLDKRKETPSKTAIEFEKLTMDIYDQLDKNTTYTAMTVGEQFNISTQKATAVLKALVERYNKMKVENIKGEKSRSVKGYTCI